MATSTSPQSHRPWREIAKEASEEHDVNRALELAEELIHALDAESRKRMEGVRANDKTGAKARDSDVFRDVHRHASQRG